jgi:hypothetical protein
MSTEFVLTEGGVLSGEPCSVRGLVPCPRLPALHVCPQNSDAQVGKRRQDGRFTPAHYISIEVSSRLQVFKGRLTDVFGTYPQAYEAGSGPMEKPGAAEHTEQEGSFEQSRPA